MIHERRCRRVLECLSLFLRILVLVFLIIIIYLSLLVVVVVDNVRDGVDDPADEFCTPSWIHTTLAHQLVYDVLLSLVESAKR